MAWLEPFDQWLDDNIETKEKTLIMFPVNKP